MNSARVAVFLDRDGTVNEEVDFLTNPAELHLIPGAGAAIRKLNEAGVIVCVISNQSGIARGFLTEEDLVPIHDRLISELQRDGAMLDRFYICPHHATEGKPPYNIECECRKPKPGMLLQGKKEFNLDLSQCFVVGDRVVDVRAGQAVGATTVLVRTGYGKNAVEECKESDTHPACIAESITEAVDYILEQVTCRKETV